MNMNARIFLGFVFAGAALTAVACGDDDGGTSSTTATTATGTGGAGTGGSGAGGSDDYTCEQACSDLYNCGLEKDGDAQICAGFKGGDEEQAFLNGSDNNGCIANCDAQPALKALVNKEDCSGTITTLKGLNPTFKTTCENGLSGGAGAGGGAGTGGAGGAGGGAGTGGAGGAGGAGGGT